MYIPKKVREQLKNAEIGTIVYHKDRKGFVTRYEKIEQGGLKVKTVAWPVGWKPPRLPLVIKADPPKPFKDWESYHKFCDLNTDWGQCKCAICPLYAKHCKGLCYLQREEEKK